MGKCKVCLKYGKSKTFDRVSLYQHVSSQLDPVLRIVKEFRYRPSGPSGSLGAKKAKKFMQGVNMPMIQCYIPLINSSNRQGYKN